MVFTNTLFFESNTYRKHFNLIKLIMNRVKTKHQNRYYVYKGLANLNLAFRKKRILEVENAIMYR